MTNYDLNADVLSPYLPNGVELDYYKNTACVSLVGFIFKKQACSIYPSRY
jgi:uncharacterized protein YqjF (DUF2071 family)